MIFNMLEQAAQKEPLEEKITSGWFGRFVSASVTTTQYFCFFTNAIRSESSLFGLGNLNICIFCINMCCFISALSIH
jgi:hypothetical protein